MLAVEAFVFVVILINMWLGFSVFLRNPKRCTNKFYLFLTIGSYLWLFSTLQIMRSSSVAEAEFFIKLATMSAAVIPFSFHLLALSIEHPSLNAPHILMKMKAHVLIAAVLMIGVFSPYLIDEVIMPGQNGNTSPFPDARYGVVFPVFILYMLGMTVSLIFLFYFAKKKLSGIQRVEIDFLMLATITALSVGILTSPLLSLLIESSYYIPISNALSIMILNGLLAYGIATRHIFDISVIFRKVGICSTSTLVVLALSVLVWAIVSTLFPQQYLERTIWFPIILGLAISMALWPLYSKMLLRLNSLFGKDLTMSANILAKSNAILQSITTTEDLVVKSSKFLAEYIEAGSVEILLQENDLPRWSGPLSSGAQQPVLDEDSQIVDWLRKHREPLAVYTLTRQSLTKQRSELMVELSAMRAHAVAGVFCKSHLRAIILLGEPREGGIYDKLKTDALWLFSNQLGTALENTELYSNIASQRMFMENLLDNMVNGVIAMDQNFNVSVFNVESERILGVEGHEILGKNYKILNSAIGAAFDTILESGESLRNEKTTIKDSEGRETPILLGGSLIMREDGVRSGTMLVFNDQTALKVLESQVRRSDRLASAGQLAAGMAHEIKNPLVSIKTFAELLPERYEDEEFRGRFSVLVDREVDRIDNIVNQLLDFSRPRTPHFINTHLHPVISRALELLDQEMKKNNVSLTCELRAPEDLIFADGNQLHQAFVNMILNAINAMRENGGELRVSTRLASRLNDAAKSAGNSSRRRYILAEIKDSGCGIEEGELKNIFDPFYTKTEGGAGMGLSVTHTILTDHAAAIEVKSKPKKGTAFTVALPLLEDVENDN